MTFSDFVIEEASVKAAQIVGQNSTEYDLLVESLCESDTFIDVCRERWVQIGEKP